MSKISWSSLYLAWREGLLIVVRYLERVIRVDTWLALVAGAKASPLVEVLAFPSLATFIPGNRRCRESSARITYDFSFSMGIEYELSHGAVTRTRKLLALRPKDC